MLRKSKENRHDTLFDATKIKYLRFGSKSRIHNRLLEFKK